MLWAVTVVACGQQTAPSPALRVYDVGVASLTFSYPDSFVADPKSHQGEAKWWAKWWAKLTAPDGSLAIEAMSLGYCSERLRIVEGFKSPEDYVLRELCGPRPERKKFESYDRLISRSKTAVSVVFLRHDAEWGKCYQLLTFSFADGTYPAVSKTIEAVIETARPSFDGSRWP